MSAALMQVRRKPTAQRMLGWFNVKDFGATGDGTTDDTAAFTAAAAAMSAGDKLYIPRGTYILDGSAWQPTVNNITIEGAGWGSVLKLKNSASGGRKNLIELGTVSGWTIRDLALDGNKANNTSSATESSWHGIYGQGAHSYCTIENVYVHDTARNGIFSRLGSDLTIRNCFLDGKAIYDVADRGGSEGGIAIWSPRSRIVGNRVTGYWKQIYVSGQDTHILDNVCDQGATGVGVQQLDSNTIEVYNAPTGTDLGIWSAATAYTTGQTVSYMSRWWKAAANNTNSAPTEANANWTLQAAPYRCIVMGNTCLNVWWQAIQMGTGSGGGIVEGNVLRSISLDGTTTAPVTNNGITVNDTGIKITNNDILGFRNGVYANQSNLTTFDLSAYNTISGNHIANPYDGTAVGSGIYTQDPGQSISDNFLEGASIYVLGGARSTVKGNRVLNVPYHGLLVSTSPEILIAQNVFDTMTGSNHEGIQMTSSPRARLLGNVCRAATRFGIYIWNDGTGNCDDTVISGNTVVDNGNNGIQIYQAKHCVISGNRSGDSRSGGSRTQLRGLSLTDGGTNSASDYHTVTGNDLSNNSTAAILITTTGGTSHQNNKISQNQGYNPVGALTEPSVPSSTVAQTNTFGVDCMVYVAGGTVSAIAVGGDATGMTGGAFLVPAGSTITLTYSVAPTWVWQGL